MARPQRRRLRWRPERMLLIGHSAGAHLVSLVTTDPRYVERHGVEPWQLIGTVALDSDAYDVADRIAETASSAALPERLRDRGRERGRRDLDASPPRSVGRAARSRQL